MNAKKKRRLRAAGFKTGTVQDFLGLTDEDMAYIEMRIALARALKNLRRHLKVSQTKFAELVGSSQSR